MPSRCAPEPCAREAADERRARRTRRYRREPRTLAGHDRRLDRHARDPAERDVSGAARRTLRRSPLCRGCDRRAARRPPSSKMRPHCPMGKPASSSPTRWRRTWTLGALARARVCGPVIAITGSTGKTTTKALAARAIEAAGRPVTATPENENNEIGVAKFLLSLDEGDERVAIVEFGARKYRDLDPLVRAARPDIGGADEHRRGAPRDHGQPRAAGRNEVGTLRARCAGRTQSRRSPPRASASPTLAAAPLWFGIDAERPPKGTRAVIVRIDDRADARRQRRSHAAVARRPARRLQPA